MVIDFRDANRLHEVGGRLLANFDFTIIDPASGECLDGHRFFYFDTETGAYGRYLEDESGRLYLEETGERDESGEPVPGVAARWGLCPFRAVPRSSPSQVAG